VAGERVLVVDDEGQIRKVVQTFLQKHGYVVSTANDGQEALLAIRTDRPHIVITDVSMPNLNGLELTRRLRSEAATARLPIIMLSARKLADEVLAGYAQGADEYIAKPVELAVLEKKVELLLRRSREAETPGGEEAGRVCVFLHGKGGVGTTTLAVNGAIALASTSTYRVSLLDLALEFANCAMLLDLEPPRSLADLSDVRIADMSDDLFDLFVARHPSGLRLVTGADRPELAELVTVPAVHHAIGRLRASSDHVLVDCAATFTQHTLAAVDAADVVAIVTTPHLASMKSALDVIRVLERLEVPADRLLLILNRTTASGLALEQVTRFFGRKAELVVPFTPPFSDAADEGKPLVTSAPQNVGSAVIRDLAARIAVATPVAR
jgi:Flp pilus assembly CpaE family ATPase